MKFTLSQIISQHLRLGFGFLAVAFLFWFITQLTLLGIHFPPFITYGRLKPVFLNLLVFGGFYTLFKAVCLQMLKEDSPATKPIVHLLFLFSFFITLIFVPVGCVLILMGKSSGRELGEFPLIIDILWNISQLVFIFGYYIFYKNTVKNYRMNIVLGTLILQGAYYFFGNFAIPYRLDLLSAVPLYTGYADYSSGQIYLNGIHISYVILPIIVTLCYYLPRYTISQGFHSTTYDQNQVKIDEQAFFAQPHMRLFFLLALLLPPIAQIGLFDTPVSLLVQYINIIGYLLLQSAILMAAVLVRRYINNHKELFSFATNPLGVFLRFGIFVLIVKTIIHMLLTLPVINRIYHYSAISNLDLSYDFATYATILFLTIAMITNALITNHQAHLKNRWFSFVVITTTTITIILGIITGGINTFLEGMFLHATTLENNLEIPKWEDLYFIGSIALETKNSLIKTLLGFKGVTIVSSILLSITIFSFGLYFTIRRYGVTKS